jgi:hypothetical protein
MLLGELRASFPWGILLITDEGSKDPIPDWTTGADQITGSRSSIVIKIRHEVDGPALVRVWDAEPPSPGAITDERVLTIASGILQISDALVDQAVRVPITTSSVRVKLIRSEPVYASEIDIVVEMESGPHDLAR